MTFRFEYFSLLLAVLPFIATGIQAGDQPEDDRFFAIAIHGGAGTILRENMTPEMENEYRQILEQALRAGYEVLKRGGEGVDAVEEAIKIMEDSPLFNAGKGAVFTSQGTNELDASIMNGKTLEAGSVAGVQHIRNPISLARKVMEKSEHVMMVGDGAETFAKEQGMELVDASWFYTERRWEALKKIKEQEKAQKPVDEDAKHGTVGVVVVDKNGNLAAGTSTGGMTNKKYGRVGDSPIIGAGTYADNQTCAISATGHGEFFIRAAVTHDISARMAYGKLSLQVAADQVIKEKLVKMGGTGGVVAIDPQGNVVFSFNTPGMYRGYMKKDGQPFIGIYND